MSVSINIFTILISLIALSLAGGVIKIFIHKLFDFCSQQHLWLKYSLFFMVAYGIYLFVSFKFPYDNFPKILTILVIVIAEILIFYFKYYNLEDEGKYTLFVLISTVFNGMFIYIFLVFLSTFLVLSTA